ncbi:FAD-binding oxidoreductase [Rhodococcus sp. G-MC3]|uniref:globin domain-containing protein n=1 Tax=Rhodococcus sp. G-MC3 TaxID=3046209 RepID=UPI0024BB2F32|nr:globin domain-containing protein [Rhodococcus sp. G-MC3]MDJ0395305.1 FAD-binding oxidoreductase [Rhodococcus sp. G-MC3]
MDARAISLVRTTFKAVAAVEGGPGKLTRSFYAILFARNPGVRDFFPASMEVQRDKLVTAIAYAIDQLEDLDRLLPFLGQLGRDHRKYGIVDAHYAAVGDALITALEQFAGNEIWTEEVDSAWREVIAVMAGTMIEAAAADDGPPVWQGTVVEHLRVLDDVSIVRLKLDEPMDYSAGQYVSVSIPSRPRMWRYLSPSIPANAAGEIEFHIRRVSGGWVSPAVITNTARGDRWTFGSPLGSMTRHTARGRDRLLIASGTGIAPLRAQLMEMASRTDNARVHVFYGGRYPCDLYDLSTLQQLAAINPWLSVVGVVEDETDPWWYQGQPGGLPSGGSAPIVGQLGKVVAEFGTWADRDIQIVGSPSMINTTKFRLQSAGVDVSNVRHDPW